MYFNRFEPKKQIFKIKEVCRLLQLNAFGFSIGYIVSKTNLYLSDFISTTFGTFARCLCLALISTVNGRGRVRTYVQNISQ